MDDADPGRFELALAAADMGCFDWDIALDRFGWDDGLCRITGQPGGHPPASIATYWDVVLPEDLADVAQTLKAALDAGGEFATEHRIVRPDGAVRWVDVHGRVLRGPDGEPSRVLGVVRDSTDLRTARDTVARALENTADAFVSLDSGWRVTYVNRPAAELMRVDRANAQGQVLWDLWPAMVRAGHDAAFHLAAETGEPTTFPLYDVEAGRWHQVRVVPAADGVSVFATDITAVRAAERERSRDLTRQEQARRVLAYSQALAEADTVADITQVVATMVLPAFDATGLLVSLADSGKLWLAGHTGYGNAAIEAFNGLPIDGNAPIAEVMRTRQPAFLPTLQAYLERYPEMSEMVPLTGKQAWAFAPLTVSGRALGSLTISFDQPRELAPDERSLIVSLAALLGQMLERARLRDAERDLAAELQRGLLPQSLGQAPGLVSTSRYLPATDGMQVGGDWYEIIRISMERVGLVIGDVQGHNMHAASTMGQLRSALRAYAAEGHDAVSVVSRSNRLMADIDPGAFATCCYVEVDLLLGRAYVTRAGHPAPVLRSADGATRMLEVAIGLPLGVDPDETYAAEPIELSAGDTLVLFTDGLVEDSRTSMEVGLELLAAAVRAGDVTDLEAFADGLVSRHGMAEHRPDDIALLVVRHDGLDGQRPPTAKKQIDRSDPRAARHARQFISDVLVEWDLLEQRETIVLLVSEVVTNALFHTGGEVDLLMIRLPNRVRVEVGDQASTAPLNLGGGLLAESGRGVPLVTGFSDRWGSFPRGQGKVVWFELDDV
jgi:serine phosphatase RsbU (regulator of sigma subunit)/PAS domain-containing protein